MASLCRDRDSNTAFEHTLVYSEIKTKVVLEKVTQHESWDDLAQRTEQLILMLIRINLFIKRLLRIFRRR